MSKTQKANEEVKKLAELKRQSPAKFESYMLRTEFEPCSMSDQIKKQIQLKHQLRQQEAANKQRKREEQQQIDRTASGASVAPIVLEMMKPENAAKLGVEHSNPLMHIRRDCELFQKVGARVSALNSALYEEQSQNIERLVQDEKAYQGLKATYNAHARLR